jgi:hypothetical protein
MLSLRCSSPPPLRLYDRAWGRPPQAIQVSAQHTVQVTYHSSEEVRQAILQRGFHSVDDLPVLLLEVMFDRSALDFEDPVFKFRIGQLGPAGEQGGDRGHGTLRISATCSARTPPTTT